MLVGLFVRFVGYRGVADLHTVPVPNDKPAALDCNISTDRIADVIAGY